MVIAPLKQYCELVAPQARTRVRSPKRGTHDLRHFAQHLVAGRVSQRVIDRLKIIEIQEQNGDRLTVAFPTIEGVLYAVMEQGAVRQPGHRVVESLVRELTLECL